jgi:Na+-driven multidrug efflux pump
LMLKIAVAQMPVVAIAIGGMMLFQSTNRWWMACIAGLMQGLICSIPISFTLQAIAIDTNNINAFLWPPFVSVVVASFVNLVWNNIFMHKKLKPEMSKKSLAK